MQSNNFLIKKLIGFFILVLFYLAVFFILTPTIFNEVLVLIAFLMFFGYMLIEQIYKIEPPKDYKVQPRDVIIIVLFLLHPFIITLSFYEREYFILEFLPIWNHEIVQFVSLTLLFIGMCITFFSRIQLGKYGTTVIIIEEDHQLIKSGIYKYIRHPIYLGSIILFTSIGIAVGSLIISFFIFLIFCFIMKDRIELEEQLLEEKFGEEYIEYKNQSKKLIPFLY